jgi:hypothetical protein
LAEELNAVKKALGFGVSMIAAEHFISAGMSSPWSVAKFAKSDQDKRQVWRLYWEAAGASVVSALIIGWLLGDGEVIFWSLLGTAAVLVFVGSEYRRALKGTL